MVTGVMRDLPHNTQLKADVLIPNTSAASPVNQEMRENWLWLSRLGLCPPGAGRRSERGDGEAQDRHRPFASIP